MLARPSNDSFNRARIAMNLNDFDVECAPGQCERSVDREVTIVQNRAGLLMSTLVIESGGICVHYTD